MIENIVGKITQRKKVILKIATFLLLLFVFINISYAQDTSVPEVLQKMGGTWTQRSDGFWQKTTVITTPVGGSVMKVDVYDSEGNKQKEASRQAEKETSIAGEAINILTKAVALLPFTLPLQLILNIMVWLAGHFSTLVIALLFTVAEYNYFIYEKIVVTGWVLIRDMANMFFVLILLVIAFATILRMENYSVKRLLPKLLIMAVLINFSKTICGLFIDFSQVIMLTFLSGLKVGGDFYHAGLVQALHLDELFNIRSLIGQFTDVINPDVTLISIVGTMIYGFILLVVAIIVIGFYTLILLYRIIMLWILVILSPLAYLAAAFPGGQRYSGQWWSEFSKQIIVGPVMIFFLWLAISISSTAEFDSSNRLSSAYKTQRDIAQKEISFGEDAAFYEDEDVTFAATLSPMGDVKKLLSYLMTIAFLIGGMMAAQQMGGMGGQIANKGIGWIRGAHWKLTGARRVAERWRVFQGEREAARKEKAAATGRAMFRTFEGAKGIGAGARKALWGVTGRKVTRPVREWVGEKLPVAGFFQRLEGKWRAKYDAASKKEKSNYLNKEREAVEDRVEQGALDNFSYHKESGAYLKNDAIATLESQGALDSIRSLTYNKDSKEWELYNEKGQAVKDKFGRIMSLKEEEVLTDKEGDLVEKYGRYADKEGEHKYDEVKGQYYKVNKKGEAIDKEGNVVTNPEKRVEAKVGKKWGAYKQELMKGWKEGRSKAWGLQAKATQEKIGKQIEEMQAAGISSEMMRDTLTDAGANKMKRLASALTLAIKEGFKGVDIKQARAEVKEAKGLIGSNKLLEKQFGEAINKRFAHLNYDLSTELGREQIKGAQAEGLVDLTKQDASAYGKEMVQVMEEYFGTKQFIPKLDDTAKISGAHRTNLIDALKETVKGLGKPVDEEGKVDLNRVALANLSGDLHEAMAVKGEFTDESAQGVATLIESAKVEHLAKIDVDLLNKSDVSIKKVAAKYFDGDTTKAENLIDKIRAAVGKSMNLSQLKGINTSRDATQDLKAQITQAVKDSVKAGKNKKIDEGALNRYLKNIGQSEDEEEEFGEG